MSAESLGSLAFIGILLLAGGLFSAGLGSELVDWERKDRDHGGKCAVFISAIAAVTGLALVVMPCFYEPPKYHYTVKLHYIDGEHKTISFDSYYTPTIDARSRGHYAFSADDMYILGVFRFEILEKKPSNPQPPS